MSGAAQAVGGGTHIWQLSVAKTVLGHVRFDEDWFEELWHQPGVRSVDDRFGGIGTGSAHAEAHPGSSVVSLMA